MSVQTAPAGREEIVVRRARGTEMEAVWELAQSIAAAAHWARSDYETYSREPEQLETHAKALFVACVRASADAEETRSAELGSAGREIVGFAAYSAVPGVGGGECELENIAVVEPWRRQGIALRLLAAGMLWCRTWGLTGESDAGLRLEVRASNRSAIAFYERAGFMVTGRRRGYYAQPEEDAMLLWKPFHSPP